MTMREAITMALELLREKPRTFRELTRALGRDEAFWVLAYLAKDRETCKGVQIEPEHNIYDIDIWRKEVWLIRKWDYRYFPEVEDFYPNFKAWAEITWRLKDGVVIDEIPVWEGAFANIDP